MEERIKQRLIGVLVVIGALFIILPFLFHNPRPSAGENAPTKVSQSSVAPTVALPPASQSTTTAATVATQAPTTPAATTVSAVTPHQTAIPATAPSAPASPATPDTPLVSTLQSPTFSQATQTGLTTGKTDEGPQMNAVLPTAANHASLQPVVKKAVAHTHAPKKQTIKKVILSENVQAWTIQVGVFSNKKNAEKLVSKLRAQHFEAYSRNVIHDHRQLAAVFVGPNINLHKMQIAQKSLQKQFHLTGEIRKYQA